MVAGLVTIVVPIYKVEEYLDRCVSSVVNQTYKNLEIILVNDGSPDHCPQMCENWAKRDSRIKVVHKENEGLGMARNTGIENATGEYICFFDSDDYVEPTVIEESMLVAEKENADIVSFGNDRVTQDGRILARRVPTPPKAVFEGEEILSVLLPKALSYDPTTGEHWNLSLAAWASLYSMELIQKSGWRFVSEREIISEDYYSLMKLYGSIEKAVILSKVFYHYFVNPTSLTKIYRPDRYEKVRYFYQQLVKLGDEMGVTPYIAEEAAATYAGLTIGCLKQAVSSKESWKAKWLLVREIVSDSCLQDVLAHQRFSGDKLEKKMLWHAIRNEKTVLCWLILKARNIKGKLQYGFGIKS